MIKFSSTRHYSGQGILDSLEFGDVSTWYPVKHRVTVVQSRWDYCTSNLVGILPVQCRSNLTQCSDVCEWSFTNVTDCWSKFILASIVTPRLLMCSDGFISEPDILITVWCLHFRQISRCTKKHASVLSGFNSNPFIVNQFLTACVVLSMTDKHWRLFVGLNDTYIWVSSAYGDGVNQTSRPPVQLVIWTAQIAWPQYWTLRNSEFRRKFVGAYITNLDILIPIRQVRWYPV